MGKVLFKGKVVYDGPLAKVEVYSNWNNSMCDYYPYIDIFYVEVGVIETRKISLPTNDGSSTYLSSQIETEIDPTMVVMYEDIVREINRKMEESKVNYHKLVKVYKGRKVKIEKGAICEIKIELAITEEIKINFAQTIKRT